MYNFYGADACRQVTAIHKLYKNITTPLDLYRELTRIWCADSCAPELRTRWTPDNATLGQCSITAFLAQDIFGGNVYGIPAGDSSFHCYNEVNGVLFDLTSEQYRDKASSLVYDCTNLQDRFSSFHLNSPEKLSRYRYLCSRLTPMVTGCVYFARHGQTVWNVENKICGATDSPLTEKGIAQAEDLAKYILEQNIKIDEILYSPLSRARDTALTVSRFLDVPARMEVRLIEQNFGKWEGTPRNGADFQKAKESFVDSFSGGESMLMLCKRIYNLLDDIKKEPEKTYLLVAHNGIARAVNSYFYDMTNKEYASFGIRNCSILRYDF